MLEKEKISPALISIKRVKPLSEELYSAIFEKYDYIISCEENSLVGGYGSAVLEIAQELSSGGKIKKTPKFLRIGYPDCFIEQGSALELAQDVGMTPKAVAEKILAFLKE